MTSKLKSLVLALVCCVLSSGCLPDATRYLRVDAPGATYFHSDCYGTSGPRSIAYYPYHGVFILLQLPDSLALHVPPGSVVQLDGNVIDVHGLSKADPFDVTLTLRAMSHGGYANMGPDKIYGGTSDPYTAHDNFGPLQGGSNYGRLNWYRFGASGSIPRGAESGTLKLPSLSIDGQSYDPQVLTFMEKTYLGIQPINC